MNDMNLYALVAITVLAGIGLTVTFFGALFTVANAFGHKRKAWGILCLILLPLSIVYCLCYWQETSYQRKYFGIGLVLLLLAFLSFLFL